MKINSKGFTLSTLNENLAVWQNKIKEKAGNDFILTKEGLISNIATSSSLSVMDIENQIAYLIKQLNPMTVEGYWQDMLYFLIGLIRQQATYTVVSRTCSGTPNTIIAKGELIIENAGTKDQFRNNDPINFDADGKALGSFTAEESGAIDLPITATINIVTPFDNLNGVYYEEGNSINIGKDYETDEEFRNRWMLTSATANANTEDGLYKSLLALVATKSDLKIFSNREASTVGDLPAHTQRIVLNSAFDNETIAKTIFDHIVDGNMAGLQGTISVPVTDSEGQTEIIKFDRATSKDISIKAEVSIKDDLSFSADFVKQKIFEDIKKRSFDMGSKIFANMFAKAIYEVESVTGITLLKVSGDGGSTWTDDVQLGNTEVPSFDISRIEVNAI